MYSFSLFQTLEMVDFCVIEFILIEIFKLLNETKFINIFF